MSEPTEHSRDEPPSLATVRTPEELAVLQQQQQQQQLLLLASEQARSRRKKENTIVWWVCILLIIIALAAAAFFIFGRRSPSVSTAGGSGEVTEGETMSMLMRSLHYGQRIYVRSLKLGAYYLSSSGGSGSTNSNYSIVSSTRSSIGPWIVADSNRMTHIDDERLVHFGDSITLQNPSDPTKFFSLVSAPTVIRLENINDRTSKQVIKFGDPVFFVTRDGTSRLALSSTANSTTTPSTASSSATPESETTVQLVETRDPTMESVWMFLQHDQALN